MSRSTPLALLTVALTCSLATAQSPGEKKVDTPLPGKAVARYRPVLADADSSAIHSLAWAPDGKSVVLIVVGSRGDTLLQSVRLWDSSTSRLRADFGPGSTVAFSADGKTVAWGGGWSETVQIRDYVAGQNQRKLQSGMATSHVAFAPDGKSIITVAGAVGRTVTVWDVGTGKKRFQPGVSVIGFAFAPDGKSLAVLGQKEEKTLLAVHDIATGKPRFSIDVPAPEPMTLQPLEPAAQLAYSPDGKLLAVGGTSPLLVDAVSGKERARLGDGKSYSTNMAFSRDGKLLATIEVNRAEQKQRIENPELQDPKKALASGETIRIWDVATGKEQVEFPGHTVGTKGLAFSSDGAVLFTAGIDMPAGPVDGGFGVIRGLKGYLRSWDVKTGKVRRQISAHAEGVNCLALAPDGKSIATGGGDGLVIIWKAEEK
ncbi:hypothetical protein AYO40_05585 [Planctomycetaceae bacterium SCGC AG-212-D15]|nr:hypothetical protein AYO40_05585 [Planctomycetaceae bacterium SCGC AG-212-D15]